MLAIETYIRQAATARGINPDIAVRVARSEGGLSNPTQQSYVVRNGKRETSYGPFQLRIGGGIGDAALRNGIDPRKESDWQKGVDFALNHAAQNGWGSWYGAAKVGVSNYAGITKASRPIAVGGGSALALADQSSMTPAERAASALAAGQPSRTLRKGSTGEDVRQLEQQLADEGFKPGKIDTHFDRSTAAAVRAFEKSSPGLTVDRGVAGQQVFNRLGGNAATRDITSTFGMKPPGPAAGPDVNPRDIAFGRPMGAPPVVADSQVTPYTGERGQPQGSRFAFGAPQQLSFAPHAAPSVAGDEMAGSGGMTSGGPPSSMPTPPFELNGSATAGGGVPGASATMAMRPYQQPGFPAVWGEQPPGGPAPLDSRDTISLLEHRANALVPAVGNVSENGPYPAKPDPYAAGRAYAAANPPPKFFAGPGAGDLSPPGDMPAQQPGTSINDVIAGIGGIPNAIFGPDGALMSASKGINDWWSGTPQQPATAKPSLYDRSPPAVSSPYGVPSDITPYTPVGQDQQSGIGGYPQIASADPGFMPSPRAGNTGAQSASMGGIPLDDTRSMYANGQRDIPPSDYGSLPPRFTSTGQGWQPFPSGAKPALYASGGPFTGTPVRNPGPYSGYPYAGDPFSGGPPPAAAAEASETPLFHGQPINDTTLSGIVPFGSPAITPSGGAPTIAPNVSGVTFGNFGQEQPGMQFDAAPLVAPAPPSVHISPASKSGGTLGKLASLISGAGANTGGAGPGGAMISPSSYGGSQGAYSFAGLTPWGSATYATPSGGFSNSPYTPAGWNAPNFTPGSGGATYAYHPDGNGGGTFLTSDGRTLSY